MLGEVASQQTRLIFCCFWKISVFESEACALKGTTCHARDTRVLEQAGFGQ